MDMDKDKNFVFSPCSIVLALSLVANGAKGSTLKEFLTFLEAKDLHHLNSVAKKLIGILTEGGPQLSFVGGVWVHQDLHLSPNFTSAAEKIYKAKAEAVDFRKAKEKIDKVNKWAEDATNGLIKSVLPQGSLNPLSKLVLANALYFKGKWSEKFDKWRTRNSQFYLRDGRSVQVPFMSSSKNQFISTFKDFKVLRLPYEKSINGNEYLSMYIILPSKRDGLWALAEEVGSDPMFLERYVTKETIAVGVGHFGVPKFKITYGFEASKDLKSKGLNLCFSFQAEFDDMVLNINPELYVADVIQKSHIEVNEDGTEAAAATVVIVATFSGPSSCFTPPVDFVADHPFMFMVRDDQSGMVLFMGHVLNPLLERNGIASHIQPGISSPNQYRFCPKKQIQNFADGACCSRVSGGIEDLLLVVKPSRPLSRLLSQTGSRVSTSVDFDAISLIPSHCRSSLYPPHRFKNRIRSLIRLACHCANRLCVLFKATESFPFSVAFSWKGSAPDSQNGSADQQQSTVVFLRGTFTVDVIYADVVGLNVPTRISTYMIGPFQSTRGERAKLKVEVRLNLHGIVAIESATLMEEDVEVLVAKEPNKMETYENPNETAPVAAGERDVNMQDAKGAEDASGANNGSPESVQMEIDSKVV